MHRPLFAWPNSKDLKASSLMAIAFICFFYIFYGLAAILTDLIPYKFHIRFSWEDTIPFIPEMAYVYTSISWMMILSIFIIRSQKEIRTLLVVLCFQVVIGSIIFLLFPVANTSKNFSDDLPWIYLIADAINLKNNNFPSLHICFAVTMAGVFSYYANKWQSFLLYLWATGIALSTLLIKEHHLMDLVGGAFLGLMGVKYWKNNKKYKGKH